VRVSIFQIDGSIKVLKRFVGKTCRQTPKEVLRSRGIVQLSHSAWKWLLDLPVGSTMCCLQLLYSERVDYGYPYYRTSWSAHTYTLCRLPTGARLSISTIQLYYILYYTVYSLSVTFSLTRRYLLAVANGRFLLRWSPNGRKTRRATHDILGFFIAVFVGFKLVATSWWLGIRRFRHGRIKQKLICE
jgi:hypothetical protein